MYVSQGAGHIITVFLSHLKVSYFLEKNLSEELIKSYRDDLDFQNLIDLVQQEFECCGINNRGYLNWADNEYFNCNSPSVEKCGVPFSCCLKSNNVGDPGESLGMPIIMSGTTY